jgi:hypothetical protein
MPDSTENQAPLGSSPQPYTPPPAAVPPPKSGSSALKIILIIVGIFVALCILVAGVIGYGVYRVAKSVHKDANGQVSVSTPGGTFSANTSDSFTESDLGIAIYPGATQGKGGMRMNIAGKQMITAIYLTSDSQDQVVAFYKDKVGPNAETVTTSNGAQLVTTASNGDAITVTITPASDSSEGKTQITIIRASKG